MSVTRYIETLRLADNNFDMAPYAPLSPLPKMRGAATTSDTPPLPVPHHPDKLQAAVNTGSLLSFVDGVSAQDKDDVLYAVQLAQRGASGAFNRFSETQSWYRKYIEILENLGWAGEQFAFSRFAQSEGEFRMDKAALAIISAIATQNQLAILHESVKALAALAEDDGTIRLFDFHTSAQASGNFQLGAVQKAANGALALALGAFHYRGDDARRRFLFFRWGAQQVDFWTAAQKMTLNTTFYAQECREDVRRKLGVKASSYIADLTLGDL